MPLSTLQRPFRHARSIVSQDCLRLKEGLIFSIDYLRMDLGAIVTAIQADLGIPQTPHPRTSGSWVSKCDSFIICTVWGRSLQIGSVAGAQTILPR